MKQGAARHSFADRKHDLYETPHCATDTLLRHERLPELLWEPCAGRGAVARRLKARGHQVVCHDLMAYPEADPGITTGLDFLATKSAPTGIQCIVTNPPYKIADKFIRHGLALGCDVVVLLRLMALEGSGRSDIIDGHLTRVWAGIERLPMMHRDGWQGRKIGSSGAPFAWFCFRPAPRPRAIPIKIHRVSWREG